MGQFNNGYRRPNFNGNQNFYASNSSLAPVPASQPKSKKKLLIITAVLVVIFILVLVVIKSTGEKESGISEIESNLNEYANLLLNGKEKNDNFATSNFDISAEYALEEKVYDGDEEFIVQLIKKLDSLEQLVLEDNSPKYDQDGLVAEIQDNRNMLNLVMQFATNKEIVTEEAIQEKYYSDGGEAATNYVDEILNTFSSDNMQDYISLYKKNLKEFADAYIAIMNYDSGCAESYSACNRDDGEYSEWFKIYNEKEYIAQSNYLQDLIQNIEYDCWNLRAILKTEVIYGED